MEEWLKNLKAGDLVFISGHNRLTPARVIRFTQHHIVVVSGGHEHRFRKINGIEVGSGTWMFNSLVEATPERKKSYLLAKLHRRINELKNMIVAPNDIEACEAMIKTLEVFIPKPSAVMVQNKEGED